MARAAPLRRRPMRGGHARRRGKTPPFFVCAARLVGFIQRSGAPAPPGFGASASSDASSSLPLFRAQSLSLFGLASRFLSSLFFSSSSSSYRFRPPLLLPSFSFSSSAPVSWHCREKRNTGKEEKMEEKAPGPALSKINCSLRGRSIRLKEAAGAGAFRALRKAKPRDGLAAHTQALGAARLDAVWGVSTPRADFAPPQLKSKNPPSLWAHGQGCGPCPSFGQIGSIAESQQNSCRGPH